jgi:bifunctional non-homologous end joining protein LigD
VTSLENPKPVVPSTLELPGGERICSCGFVKPQLTRLADEAPASSDWLHEIKYDGYE